MEVYFYCTYEHSQKGFCLTRLQGKELVSASFFDLPKVAEEFFSIDRFEVLWQDIAVPGTGWRKPEAAGGFFGVRDLRGTMADGRNSTVNLAFYANKDEMEQLRLTALSVLGDYDAFRAKVLGWLRTGGPCGYQLDAAFEQWLSACPKAGSLNRFISGQDPVSKLLPSLMRTQPPLLEPDLLRLAVSADSWKTLRETMAYAKIWSYLPKPRGLMTPEAFTAAFTGRGPLWEFAAGS